jgi:hypothetical protein
MGAEVELTMNDTDKNEAIEAARAINDLHAVHVPMEVMGEADATGTVHVKCGCGVMLNVKVKQTRADDKSEAKTPVPQVRGARVFVNDEKGGK